MGNDKNFSWVCAGRRGDGTALAVSPSRVLARIHADAGRRGQRKQPAHERKDQERVQGRDRPECSHSTPLSDDGRHSKEKCSDKDCGENLHARVKSPNARAEKV